LWQFCGNIFSGYTKDFFGEEERKCDFEGEMILEEERKCDFEGE
jgi:hypothetical protein